MTHVTIAIPHFSQRRYLDEAIRSVIAQTDGRWRLIVSDGSGAGDGFAAGVLPADPRCRLATSPEPLPMAEHWNRCLTAADTELVCLLHDDDRLRPGYVAGMLAAADRWPDAAAFFCEAAVIGADGGRRFSFPDFVKRFYRPQYGSEVRIAGESGLRAVMRGNFVMCPTLCFRRSRLGDRRFDPRWKQVLDLDLTARLLLAGESLVGRPDELYDYRRHPENTTAAQTESLLRFEEERDLFGRVAAAAEGVGWRSAAVTARRRAVIRLNLGFCAVVDVLAFRWPAAGRKLSLLRALGSEQ